MVKIPAKELDARLKLFAYFLLGAFALLVGRLWFLQILHGSDFELKSMSNAIRLVTIPAPRGTFYDRNRKPLVSSRLAFSVSIIPRELGRDHKAIFARLGNIIGMSADEIAAEVQQGEALPYFPVRLARDVDPTTITRVEEARLDLPGVIVEEIPVRNYIYGGFASHLFGYLGKVSAEEWAKLKDKGYGTSDVVGKTGLERQFETLLRGKDGGQQVEVNRVNRPVRVLGTVDPVAGHSLVLTIDQHVQQVAEAALDAQLEWVRKNTAATNARAGAIIALDVRTGAVLALASRPAYDPSKFVGGVSTAYWKELVTDTSNPFQDRVTEAALAPGSTFKAVTAVAALSENVTNRQEIFYDRGTDPIYPQKACWLWIDARRGHGAVNITDALKVSCNVVFYELGRRLGIDRLARWSHYLGLGSPTGLNLYPGEYSGNVPDRAWKRKVFRRADQRIWYPIETLDVAIGQGAVQVTPIQLATFYAALANGGTVFRPYVVQAVLAPDGHPIQTFAPLARHRLNLRPDVVAVVKEGLADVVQGGTASAAFSGFPIAVAGKTGSAELSANSKDTHAWFASFAPTQNPRIAVVVMIERGGHGGIAAAPAARKVMEAYFGLDKPKPAPPAPVAVPRGTTPGAPAPRLLAPGPLPKAARPSPTAPPPANRTTPTPAPVVPVPTPSPAQGPVGGQNLGLPPPP